MNNIELDYINKLKDTNLIKLTREDIFKLVNEERNRQDSLFGNQPRNLSIPFWMIIASEEFGEISKAYIDYNYENLVTETIQTIAVLVAMLEDITFIKDKWCPIGKLPEVGRTVEAFNEKGSFMGIYEKPYGYTYGRLKLKDNTYKFWSTFIKWKYIDD